jgi:transposase
MDQRAVGSARESSSRVARLTTPGRTLPQATPTPRPHHVQADPLAQASVKAHLRPLLREVATAFPHASVELWAVDEQRIGLKPILHKTWCVDGQRPLAPVRHRYEWRYLIGFVHPATGRTLFHLATSVNIPLCEAELEAFARQAGAGAEKQLVLVLDRAGWHSTQRLRVPDHVHLLFLPPYSAELQPAEHLWPLTNTVLVNRHFASIGELEDAQAAGCVALQARPDLVRSATRFHWWPHRLHARHGPRMSQRASP